MGKLVINYTKEQIEAAVGKAKDLAVNEATTSSTPEMTSLNVGGTVYKVSGKEYTAGNNIYISPTNQISTADVVTTNTNQNITGRKNFKEAVLIDTVTNEPFGINYDKDNYYAMSVYANEGGVRSCTRLDFQSTGETIGINFPDNSGTLALTSDIKAMNDSDGNLPQIDESNNKLLLRNSSTDLYFPKGSGIIRGHGELYLNLAENSGNLHIDVLVDDFNTIGTQWVDSITCSGDTGGLRGTKTTAYIGPFWTIKGECDTDHLYITFSLTQPLTSVTLTMTTGFSVATGGQYKDLIPSNYDSIVVGNNITDNKVTMEGVTLGTNPVQVTYYDYTISSDTPFQQFTIYYASAELSPNNPKLNFYFTEIQLDDLSTIYGWRKLADVDYVDGSIEEVSSIVDNHTTLILNLDSRETVTEANVTALQNYVGDVQILDGDYRLPTPGPNYAYKFYRLRDQQTREGRLYQCINQADLYIEEGDFTGMTGNTEIKDTMYDQLQRTYWNNNVKFVSTTKVFKDTNRIRFSNSSILGVLEISSNLYGVPLNEVKFYVIPYSATKSSVVSVSKVIDGVETALITQAVVPAGSSSIEFSISDLGISNYDKLIIKSDSYDSSQDRRFYITQIKCTLGYDQFEWTTVGGGTDISGKMDKANPTGTGSFSLNRSDSGAVGTNSVAMGTNTQATNDNAFAIGSLVRAKGSCSKAFGVNTTAYQNCSSAEGYSTQLAETKVNLDSTSTVIANTWATYPFTLAKGTGAHAEGVDSLVAADYGHAEGYRSIAIGTGGHAEGYQGHALGLKSHAEGNYATAYSEGAHAEGRFTTASGDYSHVEGYSTNIGTSMVTPTAEDATIIAAWRTNKFSLAKGNNSHNEGKDNLALGATSHTEGCYSQALEELTHVEGYSCTASAKYAHAEGYGTDASGIYSHAEGNNTTAALNSSHAEGYCSRANGNYSHAEGYGCLSYGSCAHVEGQSTLTRNSNTHAEGNSTEAYGDTSHAEGHQAIAYGTTSHIEGYSTNKCNSVVEPSAAASAIIEAWGTSPFALAKGGASHAEGKDNLAFGDLSHAEGYKTIAKGNYAHVQGLQTIASPQSQFVFGEYNIEDTAGTASSRGTYVEIVGNGTADDTRANARTLDWSGNEVLAGKLTVGAVATEDMDVVTKSVTDALDTAKADKTEVESLVLPAYPTDTTKNYILGIKYENNAWVKYWQEMN